MQALPQEYRHEPALALAGGSDGLDVVRRILAQRTRAPDADGVLVVEVGDGPAGGGGGLSRIWQPTWLETSAGGDQVFLLERDQLPA